MLNDALDKRHFEFKSLRKELDTCKQTLNNSGTFMKRKLLLFSIDRLKSNICNTTKERHQRKLDALIVNKKIVEGIKPNPNDLITNLTDIELTDDEVEVLRLGLNHGILTRPHESEMVVIMEDIWDQIESKNLLKDVHFSKPRIQTALRAFTYCYLDLDTHSFALDQRRIKIIRNLHQRCMILKPDKGKGIVLIKKTDYIDSVKRIFDDKAKFKKLENDPTLTNLSTVHNYLNKLLDRGEINLDEWKTMRLKSARVGRAHGLPKTHKEFDRIPKFRPIVDTTGTAHYGIGKFLSTLLNPLTQNEYAVKDSFDAAQRIQQIPQNLFDEGYRYVSFDAVSLFTNVPLKRTVDVILDRVYNDKLIKTKLVKRTLKKLINDCCKKTPFSFNNQIYKQLDGVSMGSSLGPVLANVIMTELEKKVVKPLIDYGTIPFYIRFVDDTLLLIKPADLEKILLKFNKFDKKNLKFTCDEFEDGHVHFLDISINKTETDVYYKPTHTGQYTNFSSQTPWALKTVWIKNLLNRSYKICSSPVQFNRQISKIKTFMSWNDYPRHIAQSFVRRFKKNLSVPKPQTEKTEISDNEKLYIKVPYLGNRGDRLVKDLVKKLRRYLKPNVRIIPKIALRKCQCFALPKIRLRKIKRPT